VSKKTRNFLHLCQHLIIKALQTINQSSDKLSGFRA
jgi:hypothetical protein